MKILSEYKYKGRLMYRLAGVLCALLFGINAVHIRVPGAYTVCLCYLSCGNICSADRQVIVYRLTWYASHYMYAEFQSQRMDVLRQRSKALPACG